MFAFPLQGRGRGKWTGSKLTSLSMGPFLYQYPVHTIEWKNKDNEKFIETYAHTVEEGNPKFCSATKATKNLAQVSESICEGEGESKSPGIQSKA